MVTSSLRDQRKEAKDRKKEMGKEANIEARRVLGEKEGGARPREAPPLGSGDECLLAWSSCFACHLHVCDL